VYSNKGKWNKPNQKNSFLPVLQILQVRNCVQREREDRKRGRERERESDLDRTQYGKRKSRLKNE
jgi:hypothetical protein